MGARPASNAPERSDSARIHEGDPATDLPVGWERSAVHPIAEMSRRTFLFVQGSANIGGTELQALRMARWLRTQGYQIITVFDCTPGPILDLYAKEGLKFFRIQDQFWPSESLREWIDSGHPHAALLHGLRVNLKWRLWLWIFLPRIRRWGTNRGLSNTARVHPHRILLDLLTMPLLEGYVCNSLFVRDYLVARGFPRDRLFYQKNFVRFSDVPDERTPIVVQRGLGRGFDPIIPSEVPVITYVANVRPVKGHMHLIRALGRLKRKGLSFICLLVGDLPRNRHLIDMVKRLGLELEIVFVGLRADAELILARSDIFVFTSMMESCPNAVLEAMRAKLPVVASPWGDQSWLIEEGKGGFVVDPRNTRGLADKIELLMRDPDLRLRFGEHNRARVREAFAPPEVEAMALSLFRRMSE